MKHLKTLRVRRIMNLLRANIEKKLKRFTCHAVVNKGIMGQQCITMYSPRHPRAPLLAFLPCFQMPIRDHELLNARRKRFRSECFYLAFPVSQISVEQHREWNRSRFREVISIQKNLTSSNFLSLETVRPLCLESFKLHLAITDDIAELDPEFLTVKL